MKTEKQMLDLLIQFAKKNQDIRLFAMNGSRINTKVADDSFKDYDVVFFTDNITKYQKNSNFLSEFGEIMLSTEPENGLFPATFLPGEGYIYLVQYMDGNRIDFQFRILNHLEDYLKEDSLTKIILDKDKRVKELLVSDDSTHWVKKPTPELFQASIEELWWQILNTLKALAREELTVAFFYLTVSREELMRLLTWRVALTDGFDRSYGKQYHQILNRLDVQERNLLEATYCRLSIIEMTEALKNMKKLAESVIPEIAKQLSYSYEDFKEVPYLYLKAQRQTDLLALIQE